MSGGGRGARVAGLGLLCAALGSALAPGSASALKLPSALKPGQALLNLNNPVCGAAGVLSSAAAKSCGQLASGSTLLKAGQNLLGGNVSGAAGTLAGGALSSVASTATTALSIAAISGLVVGAAQSVLEDAAAALGASTAPQLRTTWFSSTYWRMAAIAALLTLPFLFAAAVQALLRSDLALLLRAAFGYLPLAMLAVGIAAPLTMLLLAASDQLCTWISAASGNASARVIARASVEVVSLTALAGSPFLAFLIGLFLIAAAFALWIELLLREAAVYVIVMMLPLAFAALVWPARRIWAIRGVELLVALILSKFAIVAVLSLGGAAISASAGHLGVTGLMAGAVLMTLATFSPWALLRLIPLAELASGAVGTLHTDLRAVGNEVQTAFGLAKSGHDAVLRVAEEMNSRAGGRTAEADESTGPAAPSAPPTPAASSASDGTAPPTPEAPSSAPPHADGAGDDDAAPSAADRVATQPALDLGGERLGPRQIYPSADAP